MSIKENRSVSRCFVAYGVLSTKGKCKRRSLFLAITSVPACITMESVGMSNQYA